MLRVITEKTSNGYQIELHGILGDNWVPLLEEHWRMIASRQPAAAVTVVLSDVEFIDRKGERLLRRMALEGVEFEASGCLNRYVIEKLRRPEQARKRTS